MSNYSSCKMHDSDQSSEEPSFWSGYEPSLGMCDQNSGFGLLNPLVSARAGNAARNSFIQAQIQQAYDFGLTSPLKDYSNPVFRSVDSTYKTTYADHTHSKPGRVGGPGQSTLSTSETIRGVEHESKHHGGLDGSTVVKSQFDGPVVDTEGSGKFWGGALDTPYGKNGDFNPWYNKILGEDSYTIPRALSDGARTQGASAVRMQAATSDASHVHLFPENMSPDQLSYISHQDVSKSTRSDGYDYTPSLFSSEVQPMVDGATPNRNLGDPNVIQQDADAHGRGGNAGLFGAIGGTASSLWNSYWDDGQIDGEEVVEAGGAGVLGAGTAIADDMLTKAFNGGTVPTKAMSGASIKSGALIDGVISAGTSLWQNADAYERGDVTSGQATADVVVDTGVGVASGLAGMAAGAAIGSVFPVAGTALGALIGFGAGMLGSWLANSALEGSGLADWAREGLGGWLDDNFQGGLDTAWEAISNGQNYISDLGSEAWEGMKDLGSDAWDNLKDAGAETWEGLSELGKDGWATLAEAGSETWEGVRDLGSDAWNGLKDAGTNVWDGLGELSSGAWEGAKELGSDAWEGAKDLGSDAWEGAKDLGSDAWEGAKDLGGSVASWMGF